MQIDDTQLEELPSDSIYDRWIREEGVPIFDGYHIDDVKTLPLGDWPRIGGRGTITTLEGTEGLNDAHIVEIPAGSALNPERHLYEEMVYVVAGRGSTRIWNTKGARTEFEWGEGSLFSIPINASHQHFNGSGREPARFYIVTNAPLVMRLFHNQDFVFNCDFEFEDRFSAARSEFSGEGKQYARRVWDVNFIPDVRKAGLREWKERGAGGTNINIEMSDSSMCAHISEFPAGTYKKAHRHGAGAHVIIIGGEGYDLLWFSGQEEPRRIDWHPGSVIVPPNLHWHQHFNTGATPARYLALRWGSVKYPVFKMYKLDYSHKLGGDQIEYEDEDPSIRAGFEKELAAKGVASRMGEFAP